MTTKQKLICQDNILFKLKSFWHLNGLLKCRLLGIWEKHCVHFNPPLENFRQGVKCEPFGFTYIFTCDSFALLKSQPAFISSVKEVSREFKSTLEREIGLDEMSSSTQNTLNRNSPNLSNTTPTPLSVASPEESDTKGDPSECFIFLYI